MVNDNYTNSMSNQNRRNPNGKYRKDAPKGNSQGPRHHNSGYSPNVSKTPLNKNGPKHYNHNGNYDSTPNIDGNGPKMHQYYDGTHQPKYNHSANHNKRDGNFYTPEPPGYFNYVPSPMNYPVENSEHIPVYMPMNVCPPSE